MFDSEFKLKKYLLKNVHMKASLSTLQNVLREIERYNAVQQNRPEARVEFCPLENCCGMAWGDKIQIDSGINLLDHKQFIKAYTVLQHESWHIFQRYIANIDFDKTSPEFKKEIKKLRLFIEWNHEIDFKEPKNLFAEKDQFEALTNYYFAYDEKQAYDLELKILEADCKLLKKHGYKDKDLEEYIDELQKFSAIKLGLKNYFLGEQGDGLQKLKYKAINSVTQNLMIEHAYCSKRKARKSIYNGDFLDPNPDYIDSKIMIDSMEDAYNDYLEK